MTESSENLAPDASEQILGEPTAPPQYGVGPFSVREVALMGVWAVAFIVSFFPRAADSQLNAALGVRGSVWGGGLEWVLTIGLPTVAVGLIVLRRLSPGAIRRVGSLGIDQFASVAFSIAAVVWATSLWGAFGILIEFGVFVVGWVPFVSCVLMVAGVVLTVAAPFLPVLGEDFAHRPEQVAHPVARATRPVVARPAPVFTPPADSVAAPPADSPAPYGATGFDAAGSMPAASVGEPDPAVTDVVAATPAPAPAPAPSNQPFWALAPVERDIIDETGATIFRIGPTAWALVLEDRGDYFVVRHDDGHVGYLMDVSDIRRG